MPKQRQKQLTVDPAVQMGWSGGCKGRRTDAVISALVRVCSGLQGSLGLWQLEEALQIQGSAASSLGCTGMIDKVFKSLG